MTPHHSLVIHRLSTSIWPIVTRLETPNATQTPYIHHRIPYANGFGERNEEVTMASYIAAVENARYPRPNFHHHQPLPTTTAHLFQPQ